MNGKNKLFACDFETTVYEGQTSTEVWSAAFGELFQDEVTVCKSINDFFEYFKALNESVTLYFHNAKFDGNFILAYLFNQGYSTAICKPSEDTTTHYWLKEKEMPYNSFNCVISDRGVWYSIVIKTDKGKIIKILDSYKLLPFKLKEIGDSFKTKHKKLDMEYVGYRYSGCDISLKELEYIKNDILVLKEALEIFFSKGHTKMTIGSCCLSEYIKIFERERLDDFDKTFINLSAIKLTKEYGDNNADTYIRKAYKGGWCYLKKGCENKVYQHGLTCDVNSLYPSVMHSISGCGYPTGKPIFWKGNFIPNDAIKNNRYFFIRLKTRFYLKKNHLPTIQIKGNPLYVGKEWLESSDYYNKKDKRYYRFYYDYERIKHECIPELTLTMTDYYLLKEHYNLEDTEIISGCYFNSEIGLFDTYIDKYKEIKLTTKGAEKTLAKLFLNNLYGKFATSSDSSFKVPILGENGVVKFYSVIEHAKPTVNIAIGAAITSYARYFTITHAQENYKHFIYADTDSIHCNCDVSDLKKIDIDSKEFCKWKCECKWDSAIYVRQKTYIEHITHENEEKVTDAYYKITCAGLPDNCKNLMIMSLEGYNENSSINENYNFDLETIKKLKENEKEFIEEKRNITDFKVGITIPSKLKPHRIVGGVVLAEEDYIMRSA